MECLYVTVTSMHVVVCSEDMIWVWQYRSTAAAKQDSIDPHYLVGLGSAALPSIQFLR